MPGFTVPSHKLEQIAKGDSLAIIGRDGITHYPVRDEAQRRLLKGAWRDDGRPNQLVADLCALAGYEPPSAPGLAPHGAESRLDKAEWRHGAGSFHAAPT